MASGSAITVEVTDAVHARFRDIAQAIFDQYGIVIKDVMIEWIDGSPGRCMVRRVESRASKCY